VGQKPLNFWASGVLFVFRVEKPPETEIPNYCGSEGIVLAITAIPLLIQVYDSQKQAIFYQPIWDHQWLLTSSTASTLDCNPSNASAMPRIGIPIASTSGPSDVVPTPKIHGRFAVTTVGKHGTTSPQYRRSGPDYCYPDDHQRNQCSSPGHHVDSPGDLPSSAAHNGRTIGIDRRYKQPRSAHMAGRRLLHTPTCYHHSS
jgi:hypothetical protein